MSRKKTNFLITDHVAYPTIMFFLQKRVEFKRKRKKKNKKKKVVSYGIFYNNVGIKIFAKENIWATYTEKERYLYVRLSAKSEVFAGNL